MMTNLHFNQLNAIGKRFAMVLTMLLTIGIGTMWGADTWTLVKDASDLAVGDEVVIAASGSGYALGTTQNSNNRTAVSITKSGDNITWTTAVQVLTLKDGTISGTFAFYTGSGYLYAASSSSNYLRTETTLSANSSWNISITSEGVATIKAQGTNTRNLLKKNSQSELFSCYGSGQSDVAIYKKQSSSSTSVAVTGVTLDQTNLDLTIGDEVTLTATISPDNATNKNISWSSDNPTVADVDEEGLVTAVTAGTATITVTSEDGNKRATCTVTVSAPAGGGEECTWTLITSASDLNTGDKVVIAAKDYNYAISTTQNGNNRGQASVTKNTSNNTITFGDDVQILTLEEGNISGTLAFYTGNGYLYAASSSSNYMRTETTRSSNSSWKITIADDATATVVAQGTNTRNTMQYNQSSSIFSCYSSASQKAIVIYKEVCTGGSTETLVSLNPNGGTISEDGWEPTDEGDTYTKNVETTSDVPLPTPTKDGYEFGGWYEDSEFTGNAVTAVPESTEGEKTYYAKWNCIAPTSVTVTPTNENGWRYSIGETISLEATATGGSADAYSYQWQKFIESDWEDIDGATSQVYIKESCGTGDGGTYRCVVSTGDDCSKESEGFWVRVFTLAGNFESNSEWNDEKIIWSTEDNQPTIGIVTLTLPANETYEFKVADNDGRWFGNPGFINATTDWWGFGVNDGNCTLQTKQAGEYIFTIDVEHAGDSEGTYVNVKVTFPTTQIIYFKPATSGTWADDAKFTIYSWGSGDPSYTPLEDKDCGGIYSAEISTAHTSLLFIKASTYKENFDDITAQTIDLTAPTGDKVLYDMASTNITHLYLKPNDKWKTDGARFAAYFCKQGDDNFGNKWMSMSDSDSDGIYDCSIPTDKAYPNVIFCRMNGGNSTNDWSNKWNQTGDLTIPTDGKNLFDKPNDTWDGATTSWSTIYDNSKWTTYTPNYTVTFDANGHGTAPEDQCITDGGEATDPGDLSVTGYTFGGWYKEAGCTNVWDFANDVVTSDITLYAKWTVNTHKLTWNLDGGTVSVAGTHAALNATGSPYGTLNYGDVITAPTVTRTGYTFNGWSPAFVEGTTMPDKDLTYTAQWLTTTTLAWSAETCTVTIASPDNDFPTLTVTPEAIKSGVKYESSDTDVATIDATGRIVLKSAGITIIRAYYEADATYAAAQDTYELTVEVSTNCRWEEVTIDEIEYGDEVVIATLKNGKTYALKDNDDGASSAPPAIEISINQDKTINTAQTTISTSLIWNIDYDKENTKNLVIYSTKNTGKWLYSTNENDGIRIGTNTNKEFKIVEGTGDDAGNIFLYHNAQGRYLGVYYQKPDWRGYTTINSIITGQTLKFYKRVCLPEGQYWVKWMVNGEEYTTGNPTTIVDQGEKVTTLPTIPADYQLPGCTSKKFLGWTTQEILVETNTAPTYFTDVTGSPAIEANQIFHALFADGEGGTISSTTMTSPSSATTFVDGYPIKYKTSSSNTYFEPMRLYADAILTFSGSTITKIVIDPANGYYTSNLSCTEGGGTFTNGTWTGSATQVSFKADSQVRIDEIEVTYGSFSGYITSCCIPWTAPALSATTSIAVGGSTTITHSGTTHGDVTYTSSNTAIATVDANGKVTGVKPGQTTITATWDGVDGSTNYCSASATIDITVTGSFTITYNANNANATGSTAATTIAYPTGEGNVATNSFALDGHEFVEWNTQADGSGTSYNEGASITLTEDITLYAIWQPNQYDITVNVVGGSVKLGSTTITTQQTITDVVAHGQSFTFTNPTPDAAYSSTYTVTLNSGTATVTSNSLTVSDVQSDLNITITFTAKPTYTVTYVVPTEDGRSVAPTSIYEGGSVTMPDITGTINSNYSCEKLIGWTTEAGYQSGSYEDMNGQMPMPFYAIGDTLSNITQATTLYAVYSRLGQGASGTVELTQSNIQDFYTNTTSENRAYNIEKTYTASEYSFMTNGQLSVYSSTTYRINLRNRTNSNGISWIKLPALPGEITKIEASVSQGNSNNTSYVLAFQSGKTTNETVVASSESTSGISRTIDVPSGHTSGYITCTSDGTINVESLVIHYGSPNIISTFLKCTNDIDGVKINYYTNTSYLPAGSVVNNTCNSETFKFSELPNGQYTICDNLTPPAFYQHIGWNSQANGNGSVSYEPGQVITMVDYTPVNLYAQWAPEVVVIDGDATSGEVMVPETMGGSITLPTGSQLCDDPAYHYDFIGWTTEDALLWNQGILSPEILPMNGDGTTTFTPTEPTTVYAVYGQEKTANSKAFYLTYTYNSQTYYAQLHSNYVFTGTTDKTNAVKLYMEQIAKEYSDRYYLYYIQDNEKVYVSWNSASDKLHIPSSATENDGWIVVTSGSNYTFQSVAAYNNLATKYLKAVVDNDNQRFGVAATAFNFQLESTSEYVYLDNTTCSDQIRIKFVDGGGTLKDGATEEELTTPYMYATAGDVITLPYCEYDGWEFLGWVEEYIEPTEIIEDASRRYQGKSSFTVPTYNTDLYAYYEQQPEDAGFDATEATTLKMYSTVEINGTNKYYFAQGLGSQNQLTTSNICALGLTWNFIPVEDEAGKCYIQDTLSGLFLSAVPNDNDFAFTEQPETWNFVNTDTVPAMNLDANNKWWIWNDKTPDRMILFQNNADIIVNGAKSNFTSSPGTYNLITIGDCFNPVYTTDPILCQSVSISGVNKITATKGQSVKSSTRLIFMARNQELQTQVTISAPNIKFYNRNGDEVTTIPITSSNVKEYLIAEYTPTEYDVLEKIDITAVSSRKTITIKNRLTCRSLPDTFAIVTQVGKIWYALPSDCSTSGNPVGYPIEVDDMDDPTTVAAVPDNADWQLYRVYKSNGSDDRYTENGDNLVFTETSADSKTLYGSTGTTAAIQTYAKYENYYQTNPGNYEWTPTTTDLVDYKLKNEARNKYLSANFLTEYGIHSSQVANSEVRFLPITDRYTPLAAQVVEWKENSLVIMYDGDPAQTATISINGAQVGTTTLSFVKKDEAVYELPATGLASNPAELLSIAIGSEKLLMPIPYIISSTTTDKTIVGGTTTKLRNIAKATDLIILDDAKLTSEGTASSPFEFRHVNIYGGGALNITTYFGVNTLTMRVGAIENGEYVQKYPQLFLSGKITKTSDYLNVDYVTTYERYYSMSLPYAANTADIHYPSDIYGNILNDGGNKASFALQYYDGEVRATGATGWKDLEEPATLEAYKGYTFWGAPRKVKVNGATTGIRQTFGIHRIPIKIAATALTTEEKADHTIDIYTYPAERPNDMGWNYLGNPYLAQYGNLSDDADVQVGLLEKEIVDDKWTGNWVRNSNGLRYVTFTNDGHNYWSEQVANATFYPFNTFFIQAAADGALEFANASRVQSLPARHLAAEQATSEEITTGIMLTGNNQTDRTGLLIADNFTEEYDFNADLSKFENSGINLYTIGKDGKLAFMAINQALAEQPIPLGYGAPADGEYTIAFDEDRYNATDISALYLIDYDRNEKTNLLHTNYSFVTTAGTNNERFVLQVAFIPQNATSVEWVDDATIQVAVDGNNLLLNNLPTDAAVHVFDALGRVIYATPNAPTEMQVTLPTGYYLVRIGNKQQSVIIDTVIP